MIFEQYKRDFMKRNIEAAHQAGVFMSAHAAAAAALESGFGTTEAYISWNNPFSLRYYAHPKHGLHVVPQAAFHGKLGWKPVSDVVSFDTLWRCYSTLNESIACLGKGWPADSEADNQLEKDATDLAHEYYLLELVGGVGQ